MGVQKDGQPPSVTVDQPEKETATDHTPTDRQPRVADYLRIFSYATRWDICVYVLGAVSSLAAGVTLPLMNILFGQLASQFTQHASSSSTSSLPATSDFENLLSRQALYIMALFLGRWLLNSINKFCFRATGLRLSAAVRLHYLRSLLSQNIHALDALPAGAPAAAITASANALQVGVSERLGTLLQFAGTVGAALVVAFVWSWELTLVVSSLVVYTFVVMAVALPVLLKSHAAVARADAKGTAVASEALGAIRLVMAAGAQEHVIKRYERWVQEAKKHSRKTAPIFGIYLGLIYLGIFGSYGLAFWYGAKRFISEGANGVAVVIVVLMSVMMVLTSIERISTPLTAISKAMIAACEFFTVIDAPLPQRGELTIDLDIGNANKDLVFENVTFAYPSRPGSKVLDGLNLRIRSGLNTAIVGSSGSGKSTIVALLERWYSLTDQPLVPRVVQPEPNNAAASDDGQDPNPAVATIDEKVEIGGSVMIADHNIEEFDLQWWRSQIGLVQQEPFLFNDRIFDNVARGLVGTRWADEPESEKRKLVMDACKEANAHEFICGLPDGYDSRIGDGGIKLSGGQRQRIAIARSIVKKPRIIILDEATSAIDVHGEQIVQAALERICKNCTTITIAHRLSTIKKADCIVVLKDGQVVEEGPHDDLMRSPDGHYSRLVQAQALNHLGDAGEDIRVPLDPATESQTAPTDEKGFHHRNQDSGPILGSASDPKPEMATAQNPASFKSFAALIHQQRIHWLYYVGIITSAMGIAAATPLQAWLFAKVVGVFTLQGAELRAASDFWALMWLALAGGMGLSYFAAAWIGVAAQSRVSATCKASHLRGMLYQRLAFFDDDAHSHGVLTGRIASDAKQMEELLGLNLVIFLSGVFTVAGCLVISLVFGWKLALVGTFVTMPVMLASGLWKLRQEVKFDQMNSAVFMESSQFATEAIGAIRTVAAFNLEESIMERYQVLLDNHVQAALRRARINSLLFGFTDSASLGCQALVFWYGGRLLLSSEYSLEAFFVCFMAIIQGAENAGIAFGIAPNAAQAFTAANRILDVQTSAEADRSGTDEKGLFPDVDSGVQIELRDVHFRYPTRDLPIFRGMSLTIERGQYAAFVGPSGCGKTTIISLLERFYDLEPGSGEILCNGTNIKDMNRYAYRQGLSLVAQEPTMFQGTIRDNILLGASNPETIAQTRLEEVCRDASIHDFIVSLPEGYNTDVGQKGVSLSGGQKQRIALARALIRDPKILLLDEATSALDSESERAVQGALEKARRGRTMVVVAHRLSTIQSADVIFVLDKGVVVEKGTHDELLRRQGVYWNMCQSQAMDQ
ncbi:P-loop containing nucleoside triphosphate hydrolase protein [Apiospora arundinis]